MSLIVVIAARGGSKGIPRKNLQPLGDRPLIAWAIAAARAAAVGRVIVSTDDAEIAAAARHWGAETPFPRPAALAGDAVSLIPVAQHALAETRVLGWGTEQVMAVQPTAPFLAPASIRAAAALMASTGCESVASVVRIVHNHPYRAQRLGADGALAPLYPEGERFLQKQDLPAFHALTGGLYLRRRALLEGWSGKDFGLGQDRRAVEVSATESVNIDTPQDLAFARSLVAEGAAHAAAA